MQRTYNNTTGEKCWGLTSYTNYLEGLSERLLDEIHHLTEEFDDELSSELLRKITWFITVNQNIVMLHLLNFRLHMKEHDLAIDKELFEISDYMAELLNVHLREA